jgi:sporulation protein YlmC with PRC-barrel domain
MIENTDVEEEEMPTVREHVNKPVISTSDGKKLGKIKDLYLDPKLTRVTAVCLGGSGVLKRKNLMIKRDKVRTCGIDAWLVETADVVVDSGHIVGSRDFVPARQLRGRQIASEGGTEIAKVEDVILDNECNVKGFTLANYPASGPLAQRKAIALGALTSLGSKKNPMATTLARAESMEIGVSVGTGTSPETGT